jgi:hypothetical protein
MMNRGTIITTFVLLLASPAACAMGGPGQDPYGLETQGEGSGKDAGNTSSSSGSSSSSSSGSSSSSSGSSSSSSSGSGGSSSGYGGSGSSSGYSSSSGSSSGYSGSSSGYSGSSSGKSSSSGSGSGGSGTCADPNTPANCTACQTAGKTCQPNGCYNGYYCNTSTNGCHSPSSC